MTWSDFVQRITEIQQSRQTDIALILNPKFAQLPLPIQRYDDPLLPFSKAIISATRDIVCAYVFDLASYLAFGAAGAVALERSIAYSGDTPVVLHAPFVGDGYSPMADTTGFAVDALTVADSKYLRTYLDNPPHAAFLVKQQPIDRRDASTEGGILWLPEGLFTLLDAEGNPLQMRLTDDTVLYAGRGEDFAQQVRAAVEQMQ